MTIPRTVPLCLLAGLALLGLTLPGDAVPARNRPARPAAQEEPPETPIGPRWWPSEWGPKDQRGAANRLTPERTAEAARLIRTGKTYQLGRLYEHGMPLPGKRHFSLTIPGSPTGGPEGKNRMVYHDEMFSGEIG
jgi:hypothetical protein